MLSPGESQVWVYERNKKRVFRNIPKNLANRKGYYTIVRSDGTEDDQFEKLLATEVEGPGLPVLRKLSSATKQLTREEIASGASLIAMQEVRVPFMREQLETVMVGAQEQVMNFALSIPGYLERKLKELCARDEVPGGVSADELRESVRSGKIKLHANPEASLVALGHMLPMLIQFYSMMKWTVLVSANQSFLTSDAPICRYYPESSHLGAGLINPDLEVYFPISHDHVLLLTHDRAKMEKFKKLRRRRQKREAERLRERTPEIAYRNVSSEKANKINRLVIERANRWVYAPTPAEYVTELFVGDTKNVRMQVDFIDGPNLIQLSSRLR
jgi:hypothetical protein